VQVEDQKKKEVRNRQVEDLPRIRGAEPLDKYVITSASEDAAAPVEARRRRAYRKVNFFQYATADPA